MRRRKRRPNPLTKRIKELKKDLENHYQKVSEFYNDPITTAYHVPTDDFQVGFDKTERNLLSQLASVARDAKDTKTLDFAFSRLEKWIP